MASLLIRNSRTVLYYTLYCMPESHVSQIFSADFFTTVGYRFFEALGISDMKSVDTDFLKSEFQGSYVGIVIKNNEKNGVVYHNVVDFFEVDIEDSEEKDDEKYEDESEEDYYDEYEDDFEEEYDDEYEDDFEDFDRITSRRRNSKTIPRREKKRRKTNRR